MHAPKVIGLRRKEIVLPATAIDRAASLVDDEARRESVAVRAVVDRTAIVPGPRSSDGLADHAATLCRR